MTSLNQRLENIAVLFGDVLGKTYHYKKPAHKTPPYAVWAETGEGDSFQGDNGKGEQLIEGTLDFFTLTEFDPCVDGFQNVLEQLAGGSWELANVDYEDETRLIHYAWRWEAR